MLKITIIEFIMSIIMTTNMIDINIRAKFAQRQHHPYTTSGCGKYPTYNNLWQNGNLVFYNYLISEWLYELNYTSSFYIKIVCFKYEISYCNSQKRMHAKIIQAS